jgi:hypothetical protein
VNRRGVLRMIDQVTIYADRVLPTYSATIDNFVQNCIVPRPDSRNAHKYARNSIVHRQQSTVVAAIKKGGGIVIVA